MITIREAHAAPYLDQVRALFEAYEAEVDAAPCFQGFQAELAGLPGAYAPPAGCLLLAEYQGEIAGCVALRKLDEGVCEMKRLYIRPAFRRHHVGRRLAEFVIGQARSKGYRILRLDTLPSMTAARGLYARLGFRATTPYYVAARPDILYMEMALQNPLVTP